MTDQFILVKDIQNNTFTIFDNGNKEGYDLCIEYLEQKTNMKFNKIKFCDKNREIIFDQIMYNLFDKLSSINNSKYNDQNIKLLFRVGSESLMFHTKSVSINYIN